MVFYIGKMQIVEVLFLFISKMLYLVHSQSQVDMITRKADELIRNFILNDKRALLVTGARQVGKTYAIRKASKECFENVVEINFVE